ncbi:NAD+ synthase [soil metagenome]
MQTDLALDYDIVTTILTSFLKNESQRIGINKAVIGLSGGIDSAVSAFLAARAYGKENVLCVLMPYKTSSKESVTDAMEVANAIGVRTLKIEITSMVDSYISSLEEKEIANIRKGNVMARCRMIVLYDQSAKENALVIGTGNKSEILIGYSTIFGDSASALNPIGDLYKTQIVQIAKYLGVPDTVINKKPSADLWADQNDEDELGFTYSELDKYLFAKIEERRSPDELTKMGFNEKLMTRIDNLIMRNQFKRVPPIIAKIQNRTVNVDFRYNRDWNT